MDRSRVISLSSLEETIAIGKELATSLQPGDVLALSGDLGAGKTTFVKGLALGLDIEEPIQSPTYVYLNEYQGRIPLFHFDLYRLKGVEDFINLGFDEFMSRGGVCAIEWPERIPGSFLENAWRLDFSYQGKGRVLEIQKPERIPCAP